MASHKSPLRDRLLSNSPDPIKSSILRESGMGWNSSVTTSPPAPGSAGSITSPLRIAKRDSPGRVKGPAIARRTSSSYRHVHNNNLVSKSPFKSQIPAPATPSRPISVVFPTRRVSGEKRPRPSSMHEMAEEENDRPAAFKRDRKQSKAFQGLLEKEPVTKSPFRLQQRQLPASVVEMKSASIPIPLVHPPPQLSITPPESSHLPPPAAPSSDSHSPGRSPGRSALVSRRMHGPRLSGGAKRERRKTVTFHERCDVLEFDREDDTDEDVFQSSDEEDKNESRHRMLDPDTFMEGIMQSNQEVMEDDASYESIQLSDEGFNPPVPSLLSDPDASITGIVEEMFFSSNAAHLLSDTSMASSVSTPPRHSDIPTDLETEDGVPFGRSHHIDRLLQQHEEHSSQSRQSPHLSPRNSPSHHDSPRDQNHPTHSYNFSPPTYASPHVSPSTPPRRFSVVRYSTPPLGRSTHIERVRQARAEEREEGAEDLEKLPASPSPIKRALPGIPRHEEFLIPGFDLEAGQATSQIEYGQDVTTFSVSGLSANPELNRSTDISDPAFPSRIQDESILPGIESEGDSIMDHNLQVSTNTSLGNSEANLSVLSNERDFGGVPLQSLEATPVSKTNSPEEVLEEYVSPTNSAEYAALGRGVTSPTPSSGSPLLNMNSGVHGITKTASRERISREEVQRRLLNQKSPSTPSSSNSSHLSNLSPKPVTSTAKADALLPEATHFRFSPSPSEKENRSSILTTNTDFSTETAVVETAEKRDLGMIMLNAAESETKSDNDIGLFEPGGRLQRFDFDGKLSLGGLDLLTADSEVASSGKESKDPAHCTSNVESGGSGMKMGGVDVDMDMKSALDRLMEDVAGAGTQANNSIMTDEYDDSDEQSHSREEYDLNSFSTVSRPKVTERTALDSVLLQDNHADGIVSRSVSSSSTITGPPPPVPPKDNIRNREQLILEKRREARRFEQGDRSDYVTPNNDRRHLGVGRPSRRRSMSTNDAETVAANTRGDTLLDVGSSADSNDDPLSDCIEKELQKLVEVSKKSKYHVREREMMIYASSTEERISHMAGPGDVDAGRAWRMVRRPSDMNEYAKQIREYRSQDKGKAYGKVFVKVLGIRGVNLPLPPEPTAFTCTLNNGIHFVTTPECQLSKDCRVDQEFELIEHSKLEFTLTLKVRRDPHIIAQFKAIGPSPPPVYVSRPSVVAQPPTKSGGMRSFFSSSPKKLSKEKIIVQPPLPHPQPVLRLAENLARHLKPDGTLARAFVSFKDIASRCDTRLFETSYPLIGQRVELGGKFSTLEVGEIVLQLFRLPPLPGIPQDELPQSLEECIRGLRHINWHKVTYFQGTLTQNGGDCSTWRRRQLRVIGSNLVAFNDVTKKATATIDLKKAIAVEDDQEARNSTQSPASGIANLHADEYDGLYGVERSFRLIFSQDQEIIFFADSDEEKTKWLEVLRALVGRIPPHPLWAELLWQRQEEISKQMTAAQQFTSPSSSTHPHASSSVKQAF